MVGLPELKAQNIYADKAGKVSFYSKTPLEDIEAHNTQAVGIIGLATGSVGVSILVKGFKFKKALMEEHFNENYLESDKYPKAIFNGKILEFEKLDFFKPEGIEATVVGNITLHGVTQPIHGIVFFKPKGEDLLCSTEFKLKPENFKIKIPALVVNNIAKEIDVEAHFLISKKK
jgi:polyisoprenoid-binding protein YceI